MKPKKWMKIHRCWPSKRCKLHPAHSWHVRCSSSRWLSSWLSDLQLHRTEENWRQSFVPALLIRSLMVRIASFRRTTRMWSITMLSNCLVSSAKRFAGENHVIHSSQHPTSSRLLNRTLLGENDQDCLACWLLLDNVIDFITSVIKFVVGRRNNWSQWRWDVLEQNLRWVETHSIEHQRCPIRKSRYASENQQVGTEDPSI